MKLNKNRQLYFKAQLDYQSCSKSSFFIGATEYGNLFKTNLWNALPQVLLS